MALNSYNVTKQSLVYAMFNSNIFQEVKNNIQLIERFYLTDPNTMTNTLIRKLLESIKNYDLSSIDEPLFRSILANEGKTDTESDLILNEIMKYKLYDENQIKPIRDHVRAIGNQALISLAASMYSSDPEGYIKYLKTNEYKKDTSNIMTTVRFDQLDINSIISKSNIGWESHYRFINETFDPLFKYETGQMVLVMAPPGCFTGDTRIMLSDGTGIKFSDLSNKIKYEELYTWCKLPNGDISKTRIKDCWITKKVKSIVNIKIDNGSEIKCTEDHKFLMIDGSYKEAKDLILGDSLMSDWRLCEYNLMDICINKDISSKSGKKGQINKLKSQKENGTGIYNDEIRKLASKKSIETNRINKSGSAFNPILRERLRKLATAKATEIRYSNSINLLDKLISSGLSVNKDNYLTIKPYGSNYYLWDTLCNKMSLDDKIKYGIDNHKILSINIEYLDSEIPVYDLEVEDPCHNFMLYDGEVFVHNCGKTLFMMSECLHMTINGARCHWIALGDMNPGDFVQRMGAMYSGFSFAEAKLQMVNMFNGLSNLMKDRLGLTIVPASEITVDEYLEYAMDRVNDYDVFFIDYDSNFKPTKETNMYIEGGYLYDKLTTLTKAGKLVFIAAQPKIASWGKEELELQDVGESSRKQHSVDSVIGLSKGPGPNHIGKFTIPKNRRGEVGVVQSYIRLNNGRFITIPNSIYNRIKGISEKRTFSEGDINAMIAEEDALIAKAKELAEQQNNQPIFNIK